MIGSDIMRGYNDMLILYLLMQGDSYGYEISKEIEKRCKGKYIIKETTLYSAFGRLEKLGYIRPYQGGETQGRARTYYSILPHGKEAYAAKFVEWKMLRQMINEFMIEGDLNGNHS